MTIGGLVSGDLFLSEDTFWLTCLATVEAFRKECYGFLIGYHMGSRWIVQRAVPHQTAVRSYSWVAPAARPRKRIEAGITALATGHEIVGWFHSHPEWGGVTPPPVLSTADAKITRPGEVALVVSVSQRKRAAPWRMNNDGSISGTLGRFFLKFGARTKMDMDQIGVLRIHCPYAHGFEPEMMSGLNKK